jgi:actin-related protein
VRKEEERRRRQQEEKERETERERKRKEKEERLRVERKEREERERKAREEKEARLAKEKEERLERERIEREKAEKARQEKLEKERQEKAELEKKLALEREQKEKEKAEKAEKERLARASAAAQQAPTASGSGSSKNGSSKQPPKVNTSVSSNPPQAGSTRGSQQLPVNGVTPKKNSNKTAPPPPISPVSVPPSSQPISRPQQVQQPPRPMASQPQTPITPHVQNHLPPLAQPPPMFPPGMMNPAISPRSGTFPPIVYPPFVASGMAPLHQSQGPLQPSPVPRNIAHGGPPFDSQFNRNIAMNNGHPAPPAIAPIGPPKNKTSVPPSPSTPSVIGFAPGQGRRGSVLGGGQDVGPVARPGPIAPIARPSNSSGANNIEGSSTGSGSTSPARRSPSPLKGGVLGSAALVDDDDEVVSNNIGRRGNPGAIGMGMSTAPIGSAIGNGPTIGQPWGGGPGSPRTDRPGPLWAAPGTGLPGFMSGRPMGAPIGPPPSNQGFPQGPLGGMWGPTNPIPGQDWHHQGGNFFGPTPFHAAASPSNTNGN